MPVWPGDPPVVVERLLDRLRGDRCTVTTVSSSVHVGTHVDAPFHYLKGGAGIDAIPLSVCVGSARVIEVAGGVPAPVEALHGRRIGPRQRLLFKAAGAQSEHGDLPGTCLSLAAARFLAARRVGLVGVDGMSVGPAGAEGDEVHGVLLRAGVWVVEGLDLSVVRQGRFEMVCLPLRLKGADGAPARVILRAMRAGSAR